MSEELTREEVHQAVDRQVEELLAAVGQAAPPVDAITLARRHLGLVLRLDGQSPQRGRRPEPTEERQQWMAAHEIGAHLKPMLLRRLGLLPEQTRALSGESLPNLFANHLLVPACWFGDDARACGYDLLELKQRYTTAGHEILAWRLLDLPAPCIITVVDNDHVHRRRSNAWRVRRELEAAERQCQRYVNHYSRPRTVRENGWTVQGWPIHRPDWKREILRSVVETDGGAD